MSSLRFIVKGKEDDKDLHQRLIDLFHEKGSDEKEDSSTAEDATADIDISQDVDALQEPSEGDEVQPANLQDTQRIEPGRSETPPGVKEAPTTPGDPETTTIEDANVPSDMGQIKPTPKEEPTARRSVIQQDAGMAGEPGKNKEVLNVPPEVQYGTSPDLFSPGAAEGDTSQVASVQGPDAAPPVMDELVAEAEQNKQKEEESSTAEESSLKPPKNFTPDQWNRLSHEEQVEYHGFMGEMNEAIDAHDHKRIVNVVNKIDAMQKKMRKSVSGLQFRLPDGEQEMEKSAQATHSGGARRPGSKYIRKEWRGSYWHYEYSDQPHSDPKRHGRGKNAVTAASQAQRKKKEIDPGHTIEMHTSIDSEAMDPHDAYRESIKAYQKENDPSLMWVERDKDGKHRVYQQESYRQSEVRAQVFDQRPENLHEVKLKRSSLSAYAKKHMPTHENEEAGASVTTHLRTDVGYITRDENLTKPYRIHEVGEKILPELVYEWSSGAERALKYRELYLQAKAGENDTAKIFEGKGETSVNPETKPTLHRLESGDIPYEADEGYRGVLLLRPVFTKEEDEALFTKELNSIIRKAMDRLIPPGTVTKEVLKDIAKDAQSALREAVIIRQGGRASGFMPGPGSSFLSYAKTILSSQSGPITQNLAKYGMYSQNIPSGGGGEEVQGEEFERVASASTEAEAEGGEGKKIRAHEVIISERKGYIPASMWKTQYLQAWRDEQIRRWEANKPPERSREEHASMLDTLGMRLNQITSRGQASEFTKRNRWASWPKKRDASAVVAEWSSGSAAEATESNASSFDRMRNLIATTSRDRMGRRDPFIAAIQESFIQGLQDGKRDAGLVEFVVSETQKHHQTTYNESLSEAQAQARMRGAVTQMQENPDMQELVLEVSSNLERSLRGLNLHKGNPAYTAAARVLMRDKRQRLMRKVLEEVAPEADTKRRMLSDLLNLLQKKESTRSNLINLVNRYKRDLSLYLTGEERTLTDKEAQSVLGSWYRELKNHALFKSLFMFMVAQEHMQKSEKLQREAKRSAVQYFQDRVFLA